MDDGELVLPLTATRALVLTEAQMAWVPPREVSGLVRLLDQRREQHGCTHLKRVHKGLASDQRLAVLLCLVLALGASPIDSLRSSTCFCCFISVASLL